MIYLVVITSILGLATFSEKRTIPSPSRSGLDTAIIDVKAMGAVGDGKKDDSFAIQRAVHAAKSSYNIIVFPPGTYRIEKTIRSERPNTKFRFEENAKLIITKNNTGGFNFLHDNCILDNAYIYGNGVPSKNIYSDFGVLLSGVAGCVVKNSRFENIGGCNIFLNRLGRKGCTNNKIIGNVIVNPAASERRFTGTSGILLGYSGEGYSHANNLISYNVIDGAFSLSYGIAIIGHGINNEISNNQVKRCLRYGVVSYESKYSEYKLTRTSIINNKIDQIGALEGSTNKMGMGIYLMQSHNSIVKGNTVSNTLINSDKSETLARGAIAVAGSVNCTIIDNIIENSHRYGICSVYGFNLKIINNKIHNIAQSGIYLVNSSNNVVKYNEFREVLGYSIQGVFGHTKNYFYAQKYLLEEFSNQSTGQNIEISFNTFRGTKPTLIYLKGNAVGQITTMDNSPLRNLVISNNILVRQEPIGKKWIKTEHLDVRSSQIYGNHVSE